MRIFGYKLSHIFSRKRQKMAIEDKIGEVVSKIEGIRPSESIEFSKMVLDRASKCPQCVSAGICIGLGPDNPGCNCPVPGLFAVPSAECELGFWSGYDEENWAEEVRKQLVN